MQRVLIIEGSDTTGVEYSYKSRLQKFYIVQKKLNLMHHLLCISKLKPAPFIMKPYNSYTANSSLLRFSVAKYLFETEV